MSKRKDAATAAVLEVRRRGGVVRSQALIRAGTAKWAVADAVADGRLIRLRRAWVGVPDADTQLLGAAKHGVVLSCVTQARRLGLWVLGAPEVHLAAHPHAGSVTVTGAVVHRARPIVPRHPNQLFDPIENVLAMVAACQPRHAALAVWESAFRKRLVDRHILLRYPLSSVARSICETASVLSDSGLETIVLIGLRWLDVRVVQQAVILGRPVDFLIGERLVLQIDGAHHVGEQRRRDIAFDAELTLRGYHVIRVGYYDVVDDWPSVQDRVARAVAQGLHLARA